MPSFLNVLLCGLAALAICFCVGLPLARCLVDEPRLAWALAPALGWAVFSALALPILWAIGFSRAHVTALCGLATLVGVVASLRGPARTENNPAVPIWAFAAAAALAILPALGVWPKLDDGGLVLAEPLFDHSKIAIVDDIVRLGLPPGNPFFGEAGALAYYYLWQFSASASPKNGFPGGRPSRTMSSTIAIFEWASNGCASTKPPSSSLGQTPSAGKIASAAAAAKAQIGTAGLFSVRAGPRREATTPTRVARPHSAVTWARENPIAHRIGNAKALKTAHPRAGASAHASRGSSTRQRANGKPTQKQIASAAKPQSKTFRKDGIPRRQ